MVEAKVWLRIDGKNKKEKDARKALTQYIGLLLSRSKWETRSCIGPFELDEILQAIYSFPLLPEKTRSK